MRNHHLPISLFVLILAFILAFPMMTTRAQDAPVSVRVAPEATLVATGQTIDIAIALANARDIYGADVALIFDPAVIQIEDADSSLDGVQVALGTFLDPGFVLRNEADNIDGTIRFAMTQLNPSQPKSGAGTLIVIRARGVLSDQTSPLTIVRAEVAQPTGTKLPTTISSGQVRVVNTVSGPTATPIPTQGGGTPLPTATLGSTTATPIPSTPTLAALAASETQSPPTMSPPATTTQSVETPQPTIVESVVTSVPAPVEQELADSLPLIETPAPIASTDIPGQTSDPTSNELPLAAESSMQDDASETVAQPATQMPVEINQAEDLQGQRVRDIQASASTTEDSTSTFLIAGLALLGLAAVIAVIMLFIWRR